MNSKTSQATFFFVALFISSMVHGLIVFGISSPSLSTSNVSSGFQQGKLVINRMGRITPVQQEKKVSPRPKTPQQTSESQPLTPGVQSFENSVLNPNVTPEYPAIAIKRGWEGFVKLKFEVDSQGQVSKVEVIEEKAHQMLKDSALKAAKSWKFKPSESGQPYTVEKRVVFKIN